MRLWLCNHGASVYVYSCNWRTASALETHWVSSHRSSDWQPRPSTTSTTIASSSEHLHFACEDMRDLLSAQDPIMFPWHGQIGTPVEQIFEVTTLNDPQFLTQFECPGSPPCTTTLISQCTRHLSLLLSSNLWEVLDGMHLPESHTALVQDWVNLSLYSYHPENTVTELACENPCTEIQYGIPFISTPSPIIVFEITPGTTPSTVPNRIINIPDVDNEIWNYHLWGIIYYSGYHFTARLIDTHDIVWTYNSQIHNDLPQFDEHFPSLNNVHDLSPLTTLQDRSQHLHIYTFMPELDVPYSSNTTYRLMLVNSSNNVRKFSHSEWHSLGDMLNPLSSLAPTDKIYMETEI